MLDRLFLFLATAIFSFFLTFILVRVVEFFHLSQSIRQEGPAAHQSKAGTPTMGGIAFVLIIISFGLISINFEFDPRYLALIILFAGYALIGFLDDAIKVAKKRNLGLGFWDKIILQTLLAASFSAFLIINYHHSLTVQGLLKSIWFTIPALYFLLSTIMIVGSANAANLTDGLDGLLGGCALIAFGAFYVLSNRVITADAAVFCLISAAAILPFMFFNFPKARVFMGDVGSLPIGAALAGIAILIHRELSLIIIGGIFVIEALSVILQVTVFKYFKRRIFRMTPIHHHFELLGCPENFVVIGFWLLAVACGVAGVCIARL